MKFKKINITPDTFKGTISSIDAAKIIKNAILDVYPNIKTVKVPLADGGEGTLDFFFKH